MAVDWHVCESLMGGTRAMRVAGETYLPKWPAESAEGHADRLKTATLFPAYRRTVGVMASKPFAKALSLSDDVPARILALCDDIDMQGRNLHAFAADAFAAAVAYGLAGILVDFPRAPGVRTMAEEQAAGVRPYFVKIKHSQIVGWKVETIAGAARLAQLRLAETHEEPAGRFGVAQINRIRVLEPGRYEVWEEPRDKTGRDDYVLIEEGSTSLPFVPFVPCYGYCDAFMCGRPPLLDLAHLNVKHWQSQSDQDNITHVARVPILTASGIDDAGWKLTIGSGTATKLPTGATLSYTEHTGAAIGAGRESLQDLEAQMIQTGAELLVKQPGSRSATESAIDGDGNKSDLQRMAETFEDSLDAAMQIMAQWIGEDQGGHVTLFKDFGASSLGQASGQLVLSMQQGGLISKPTALREMQRRGELDAGIDADQEMEALEAEGPTLGAMGAVDETVETPNESAAAPGIAPPAAGPEEPQPSAQMAFDFEAFGATLAASIAQAFASMPATVVNVPQQAAPTINAPVTVNMPEQAGHVVNVTTPDVNVAAPQITVNTPDITVNAPEITVNTPDVTVQPSQVNVAPPNVQVTVEKGGAVKFTEDDAGNITGAVME